MTRIPLFGSQHFPASHLVSADICEGEGLICLPAPSSKTLKVKAVIAIDDFGLRGKTCIRKPSWRQFDSRTQPRRSAKRVASLCSYVKHRNENTCIQIFKSSNFYKQRHPAYFDTKKPSWMNRFFKCCAGAMNKSILSQVARVKAIRLAIQEVQYFSSSLDDGSPDPIRGT